MDKKGIFSTITGFFLIVILVFGIIIFISVYSNTVQISTAAKSELKSFDIAKQYKDSLLICHYKTYLSEDKLNENDCVLSGLIKGYRVFQEEIYGCQEKEWAFGETDPINSEIINYKLIVLQDNGVDTCIATLQIYI